MHSHLEKGVCVRASFSDIYEFAHILSRTATAAHVFDDFDAQETVLETDFGYPNTSEILAQGTTRVTAASEICHPKPKEASKVKGTAARIFKPTRPEYKESFGVQLGNIHGRSRWDIAGRAAELWHGSPSTGLRDTIQESLARPEQNIYKGLSIRQEAILHCYMIGYDQGCAHPTIAVCHPLAIVLRRSIKLISGMVKEVRDGRHERVLNMCLLEAVQFQNLDCQDRD